MLTLTTGKWPAYRRNLHTQNYHTAFAMDWLQEYDARDKEESGNQKTIEPEQDHYSLLTSSSNNYR